MSNLWAIAFSFPAKSDSSPIRCLPFGHFEDVPGLALSYRRMVLQENFTWRYCCYYPMVLLLLPVGIAGLSVRCSQKFSPYLQMQSSLLQEIFCSCSFAACLRCFPWEVFANIRCYWCFFCSFFLDICFCLWRLPLDFVKCVFNHFRWGK